MADSIIDGLNEAQRKAVMATEGPMLIIAGAGTGKTRVITAKIVHLMREKSVPSDNVLALTFTEKAANEMAERIDVSMPYSYQEVMIDTFHGFCDHILRERGVEIGIDAGFKLLDQSAQWFFLKKNLYKFAMEYYRPLGNPNKHIGQLLNHFSRLKDEDISPEKYIEYAEKKLADANDEAENEEGVKMLELAKAFQKYQELMIANNNLDFGDLQYYALRLLEKRPSVLKFYQDRFKYIMVDEFQDTNYAQYKLVSLLAKESGNLTVVGDDDQSIYKWRGASLSNIVNFEKDFPDLQKIVLTENYRSSKNILDASYSVIQHNNPYRLEARENLVKKLHSNINENSKVELWHFDSYLDEADQICKKITEFVKNGGSYDEIAVLVRTNNLSNVFIESFERAGIPFTVKDTQGLLRLPEIKDILALVRFLVNISDDIALTRLMTLDIFNIPMREILALNKKAKSKYTPLFFLMKESLNLNEDQAELEGFENSVTGIEQFYRIMDQSLEYARDHSISSVIHSFLKHSGYFEKLTSEDTVTNVEKLQNIGAFLELARKFESEEAENSLRHFNDYLTLLDDSAQIMSPVSRADSNAVSILTVHSAKGLEFDLVFIPSTVHTRFPQANRSDAMVIPEDLVGEDLPPENLHINEERRLFYVACTRAKKELIVSFSDSYEGPKKWKKSVFAQEVEDSGCAEFKDFAGKIRREEFINDISEETAEEVVDLSQPEIKKLSYSQLNTFDTCPLKYKFQYIYEIPAPSAHALNFGTSIHETVHKFYERLMEGDQPSIEMLLNIFEQEWISEGYDNKAHMLHSQQKGREMMMRFFEVEKANGFVAPAMMEQMFVLKVEGLTFRGRIDRIDKLPDGTHEIVDYKTGSSRKNANLKKDKQLFLYAIACRDYFKIPVSKLSLYYLDDCHKATVDVKDMDLNKLEEEVKELIGEMRNSRFEPTPGMPCRFCEFRVMCNAAQ